MFLAVFFYLAIVTAPVWLIILFVIRCSKADSDSEHLKRDKSITIKKLPDDDWIPDPRCPEFYDDHNEYGFTVQWNNKDEEAEIFELDQYNYRKTVEKAPFERYLRRFNKVNVYKASAEVKGLEWDEEVNSEFVLEVSDNGTNISVEIPYINIDFYKSHNKNEMVKLLEFIKDIMDYAASLDVAEDMEFEQ